MRVALRDGQARRHGAALQVSEAHALPLPPPVLCALALWRCWPQPERATFYYQRAACNVGSPLAIIMRRAIDKQQQQQQQRGAQRGSTRTKGEEGLEEGELGALGVLLALLAKVIREPAWPRLHLLHPPPQ
jgi:hypothetical protein